MSRFHLEVNVSYRCNAVCQDCNRAVGLARFKNTELTAAVFQRACDRMTEQGIRVHKCTLVGGEPILNPEIQEIMDIAATSLPGLRIGRLLTNNIPGARTDADPGGKAKKRREELTLPHPFKWVRANLDDPENPLSGKTKHMPYFWSPKDYGLEAKWENCTVRNYCGKGLDSNGWSMCGVDGTIGRLLRINPYHVDGATLEETPGICQHCPYGLKREVNVATCKRIEAGELARISPTYVEGFKRHKEEPMEFARLYEEQLQQS